MNIPKRYGESRIDRCPFCSRQATALNSQGLAVCTTHVKSNAGELKCVCGRTLESRKGKFGLFYACVNCGIISTRRVFEINSAVDQDAQTKRPEKREIVIDADDPLYFD